MIIKETKYSYNDLTVVPASISRINSRSEVNPFDKNGMLPLFTAPMSTVVNDENIDFWIKNKIIPIIPRNIDIVKRRNYMLFDNYWVALSLTEAKELFIDNNYLATAKICIDVANGHMKQLIDLCSQIKNKYGDKVIIMTGNIANPSRIDYVRCSVGSGSGCLTAPNTSVHYPIASLINECSKLKNDNFLKIKIVADGGIRNYGDVIKALALGADYVMIGSVFAGLFESAAEFNTTSSQDKFRITWPTVDYDDYGRNTTLHHINCFDKDIDESIKRDVLQKYAFEKVFYGMSTKKAQKLIKDDINKLKTSEGTTKIIRCKNTINQWAENMEAYLRSAMSYCNSINLNEFIGEQTLVLNSPAEIQAVNK